MFLLHQKSTAIVVIMFTELNYLKTTKGKKAARKAVV